MHITTKKLLCNQDFLMMREKEREKGILLKVKWMTNDINVGKMKRTIAILDLF